MTEPTERLPKPEDESPPKKQKIVNTDDLVYSGGTTADPRELVENPAVTPEMLNEPGDIRSDLLEED
jgi:adenine/guanine phosphoribosyltransferase-like PRPP-binding protein